MMHDGSWAKFRKLAKDYDPTNQDAAYAHIRFNRTVALHVVQRLRRDHRHRELIKRDPLDL